MSDQPRFKIGDSVRLRVDGSPTMIVDGIETAEGLLCAWTDDAGNIKSHTFPARSLRAATPVEDHDAPDAISK